MRASFLHVAVNVLAATVVILYLTSIKLELRSHSKETVSMSLEINRRLERVEDNVRKLAVSNSRMKKRKLYPESALFSNWGDDLSEEEQRKAEEEFQKYGYNTFLSDRLPLNREIPDTRDHR
ncbi:putative polypeptide N-acetylgalactosaminyltransferase 8 [Arapaima gigas]